MQRTGGTLVPGDPNQGSRLRSVSANNTARRAASESGGGEPLDPRVLFGEQPPALVLHGAPIPHALENPLFAPGSPNPAPTPSTPSNAPSVASASDTDPNDSDSDTGASMSGDPLHSGLHGLDAYDAFDGAMQMYRSREGKRSRPRMPLLPVREFWNYMCVFFRLGSVYAIECKLAMARVLIALPIADAATPAQIAAPGYDEDTWTSTENVKEAHYTLLMEMMRKHCTRMEGKSLEEWFKMQRPAALDPAIYAITFQQQYELYAVRSPMPVTYLVDKFVMSLNSDTLIAAVRQALNVKSGDPSLTDTAELAHNIWANTLLNTHMNGCREMQAAQLGGQAAVKTHRDKPKHTDPPPTPSAGGAARTSVLDKHCDQHGWNSSHTSANCRRGASRPPRPAKVAAAAAAAAAATAPAWFQPFQAMLSQMAPPAGRPTYNGAATPRSFAAPPLAILPGPPSARPSGSGDRGPHVQWELCKLCRRKHAEGACYLVNPSLAFSECGTRYRGPKEQDLNELFWAECARKGIKGNGRQGMIAAAAYSDVPPTLHPASFRTCPPPDDLYDPRTAAVCAVRLPSPCTGGASWAACGLSEESTSSTATCRTRSPPPPSPRASMDGNVKRTVTPSPQDQSRDPAAAWSAGTSVAPTPPPAPSQSSAPAAVGSPKPPWPWTCSTRALDPARCGPLPPSPSSTTPLRPTLPSCSSPTRCSSSSTMPSTCSQDSTSCKDSSWASPSSASPNMGSSPCSGTASPSRGSLAPPKADGSLTPKQCSSSWAPANSSQALACSSRAPASQAQGPAEAAPAERESGRECIAMVSRFTESVQVPRSFAVGASEPAPVFGRMASRGDGRRLRVKGLMRLPLRLADFDLSGAHVSIPLRALRILEDTPAPDDEEAAPLVRVHAVKRLSDSAAGAARTKSVTFDPTTLHRPAVPAVSTSATPTLTPAPVPQVVQTAPVQPEVSPPQADAPTAPATVPVTPLATPAVSPEPAIIVRLPSQSTLVQRPPRPAPMVHEPRVSQPPAVLEPAHVPVPFGPSVSDVAELVWPAVPPHEAKAKRPRSPAVPLQHVPNPASPHVTRAKGRAAAPPPATAGLTIAEQQLASFGTLTGGYQLSPEEHESYKAMHCTIYTHRPCGRASGFSVTANGIVHCTDRCLRDTGANCCCMSEEYAALLGFKRSEYAGGGTRIHTSAGSSGRSVGRIRAGRVLMSLKFGTDDAAHSTCDLEIMEGVDDLYQMLLGTPDHHLHNGHTSPLEAAFVYCPDLNSQGNFERLASVPMRVVQVSAVMSMVRGPCTWDSDVASGGGSDSDCSETYRPFLKGFVSVAEPRAAVACAPTPRLAALPNFQSAPSPHLGCGLSGIWICVACCCVCVVCLLLCVTNCPCR